MNNTFISYSTKDAALAIDLAHRFQKIGFTALTEKAVSKRKVLFADRRLKSLRGSDEVVVLLTENAINDPQIGFEFGAALSLRKKVTPIVDGVDADKMPPLFKTLAGIQYAEVEDYLDKLKKRSRVVAKTQRNHVRKFELRKRRE